MPLLMILIAAYGVGTYVGQMVDRRLADAISAADRDDPNWRLDDLMDNREPVPDAENSAFVVAERARDGSRELAKWSCSTAGSAETASFSSVARL